MRGRNVGPVRNSGSCPCTGGSPSSQVSRASEMVFSVLRILGAGKDVCSAWAEEADGYSTSRGSNQYREL